MQALTALNPQSGTNAKQTEEPQNSTQNGTPHNQNFTTNGTQQPQGATQKEPPTPRKADEKAAEITADNNVLASVIERHEALSNRIRSSARK